MLVAGFVLFAGVVLGGIFYWSYSAAPERNIRVGDELIVAAKADEAAGNAEAAYKKLQEATSRYGRAVSKKPNNLEYSQKMLEALSLMTPKTSGDAQELYQRREALLQKRTRSAPTDGAQWIKYLESQRERARLFNVPDMWQKIVQTCDDALVKVPPSDPTVRTIRSMRAFAELSQDAILTGEERATAEANATNHLKEFPQDGAVWGILLRSIAADSYRLATANRTSESKIRDAEFDRVLDQAYVALPANPMISIAHLQHLQSQRQLRNPMATQEAINEVLNPLLWDRGDRTADGFGASATFDGTTLGNMSGLAGMTKDPIVIQRAIAATEAYCVRNPNSLLELSAIGNMQKSIEQYDAACQTFEIMLAMPAPRVSMLAAYADDIKVSALEAIFEIEFGKWELAKTGEERKAALARVESARARLAQIVAGREGELALIRADARIAYAKGDFLTTITKLEEVFARQKNVPAELYLLSVFSLGERGEQGAALIKINRAIDEYPSVPQFYLIRGGIEAKLGRLMDAKRSITSLLARDPDNVDGKRMMAELKNIPGDGVINLNDPVIRSLGDAELLASEGSVEEAISLIRSAMVLAPKDQRLQSTLIQWLLFVGKSAEAQALVADYLTERPDDSVLKQLQILSTFPSRLDRIVKFAQAPLADGSPASPERQAMTVLVGTFSLRDHLKVELALAEGEKRVALVAELAEVSTASKAALAKAVELAPGEPSLLERLYTESVADGNPAQAEQVVVLAEKNSKDPTMALLLRGRIALDRNEPGKAVQFFEQATAMSGASSAAFRMLGFAREKSGDVDGAREAYKTSYERRPNDPLTIQLYSSLLGRGGKAREAREVLRNAMLAMPESTAIRNAYYDLETVYGNRADSLMERRRMYAIRPADVENARQFMKLLIESAPTREFLMNGDGSQKYPPKEWDAMGKERQDQELQAFTRFCAREAKAVYDSLLKIDPSDRLTIRTFAAAMHRSGRGIDGEAILQESANKATGPGAWRSRIDLAEFQMEANRMAEAVQNFDRALQGDDSATSDCARVVASLWSGRQYPARALEVLTVAFGKHPSAELARSITALRLETRDFVGARQMSIELKKFASGTPTFSDRLLDADIAAVELDELSGEASQENMTTVAAEFTRAVDDAIRMNPASALPFIVRASSLQRRYQRTGDPEALRQAMLDVTRAIELQGNYWPSTRLHAALQMDGGDIAAATQSVRQFVEQSPRVMDARQALIGYQLAAGDYPAATRTVEEILKLEPNNPKWHQSLADVHIAASKGLEAASDYEDLYGITKDQELLIKAILLRAIHSPPDFKGILNAIQLAPELVKTSVLVQMVGAAAISGTAETDVQRDQGKIQLREMYKIVDPAKGGFTDPWILAVVTLFPPEKATEFEKFVMEACQEKPDSALCRAMAQRFIEIGPAPYTKAREYAIGALELAANDDERLNALRVLGGAEYKAGRFAEAAMAFEQSIAIRKDDFQAMNNLAYIEARHLNKVSQAVERARTAFASNRTNIDLMDTLGYALMKSGELPEAITLLRRASRSQPGAMVFAHLAEAFALVGRKDEAADALGRARALHPDAEAQTHIDEVSKLLNEAPRG